ncbi:MAG: hypothetical protein LBG44_04625 [Gemmatimonadota bacterium]|jgi:hypothetical protein|nr:hypothetical protein [Gemmatimonadota bacterium]
MAELRGGWINLLAFLVGCLTLILGVVGLAHGISLRSGFLALIGFLLAGWAALDYRRFTRGTSESEVDGGHTIE